MQRLMDIFHLFVSKISSFFYSFLQMLDPNISFFQTIMHLMFHSLVFSLFALNNSILLLQLPLEISSVIFQSLNYTCISLFYVFYVSCMYLRDSFFQIVNFKFILSLNNVKLFSQHIHFTLQFLSITLMLLCFFSQPTEKFRNFIIFNRNHLSESIELNVKQFILVLHASLKVLQLKVEYFFKLVSQFVQLVTFLFVSLIVQGFLLLNKLLQTSNFFIFLGTYFFYSTRYNSFNVFFLSKTLFQLTDLELVPLLFFNKFFLETLQLSFLVQISFLFILKEKGYSFLLSLLSFQFPFLNLPLHFQLFFGPTISLVTFIIDLHPHVLKV